jgi:hypothetical protein
MELIRRAKSGSDWTSNELLAYNIRVVYEDAQTFFGIQQLPNPEVHPEILNTLDANDLHPSRDGNYELLRTLALATSASPAEESAVDDFAVLLLRYLGYAANRRVLRTRKDLPLVICGESRHVKVDVCLLDENDDILLLVQEDKRHLEDSDPEAQLIAGAIAAFTATNRTRTQTLDVPPLQIKIVPGITMRGTSPIFYKIPVTDTLLRAVGGGVFPGAETVVSAHVPVLPRPNRRWTEGMKPLDNRRIILSCYEAFKVLVN